MISIIDIPVLGSSKHVPQDDPGYTLNYYGEEVSKDVYTLKPTPGTELHSQFSIAGGGRGLVTVAGRLFGVRGGYFQEMVDGSPVVRGSLGSTQGKVGIIYNVPAPGTGQVMIVDDSNGYVFDLATGDFVTLTGLGGDNFLGGGSQVAYWASSAVIFVPGTKQIRVSAVNDFTTWDTTARATMNSLNTPLEAIASIGDLLYGWSSDAFEVWQDQGASPFPGAAILASDRIGIMAPNSAIASERYMYWLGGNTEGRNVVYRHEGGGRPVRLSDNATERNISALSTPSDAVGWSYQSLGHVFYCLSFQTGNRTFCIDATTNLWHERCQREPVSGTLNAVPFVATTVFEGDILALDWTNGKVLRIDDEVFTDQDNPIIRERILPVLPKESDNLTFFQSVELFGQISNTPAGQVDPQIMMRYSTDRGMTWSYERWIQAGGINSYAARTQWTGLGAAFGMSFWFRVVCNQFISWRMVRVRAE